MTLHLTITILFLSIMTVYTTPKRFSNYVSQLQMYFSQYDFIYLAPVHDNKITAMFDL